MLSLHPYFNERDKEKMKTAFEKEIDRLNKENDSLKRQLKIKENELKRIGMSLKDADDRYKDLLAHYEKYMFDYSVRIEELAEARMTYEARAEKLKILIRQYQKEADSWMAAMQKERKAV